MADTISNYSYIKKDFQTVFPEILEETKKLAAKWDPTISNESDPGVVLLKVNALITDKLSYNIDKNILEAFPESVTQDNNARNLFESLGYFPHWYQSATCTVNIRYIGESISQDDGGPNITFPRFSMVADADSSIVYTLLQEQEIDTTNTSRVYTCDAIEGVINTLEINKSTTITTNNLDINNRIYLPDYQIAENGIFITFASAESLGGNTTTWARVDNLAIQELGQYIYKFGVDTSNQTCYVEFPIDIGSLIGEGLVIRYVTSNGVNGNIAINSLTKMYSEGQFNSNNIIINNPTGGYNGQDPETIDSMYRNYKKVLGTFNTLVTLRDYINAILQSGLVSNGFVCDRTNDIQDVYTIVTTQYDAENNEFIHNSEVVIQEDDNDDPLLTAFDLKLYLLQNEDAVYNDTTYENTYKLLLTTDTSYSNVQNYIADQKSISHDYQDIEMFSEGDDRSKLALILNKFGIDCKIIPKQSLTVLQAASIQANILQALRTRFNAKQLAFGEEVTYEAVYNTILGADERIKAISLADLEFTPFYLRINDNDGIAEIKELSSIDTSDINVNIINSEIAAKIYLAGKAQLLTKDGNISYNINKSFENSIENITNLSTSTTIAVTTTNIDIDDSNATQLKDNEAIILTTPSLKTFTTYSNYVKYQYTGNTTISANSDSQVNGVLIFYWKTSKEDTNYNYAFYSYDSQNPYFANPSFNLETTGSTTYISTAGTYGSGVVQDTQANYNISQDTEHILSGDKQIEVKVQNKTTITSNDTYIYFTRNVPITVNDKKYYQITSSDLNSDNVYYIKTGEYFFLTNTAQTVLTMLGAGTKIQFGTSQNITVPVIDNQAINEQGLDALSNANCWCKTYIDDIILTAMDEVYIGGNGYIGFEGAAGTTINIGKNPIPVSNAYTVKYRQVNDNTYTTIPAKSLGWNIQSICNLLLSYTKSTILHAGQSINYTYISDATTTPVTSSTGTYTATNDIQMLANINGAVSGDGEQNTTFFVFTKTGQYIEDYLDLHFYNEVTPACTGDLSIDVPNGNVTISSVNNIYTVSIDNSENNTDISGTLTYSLQLPEGTYILNISTDNDLNTFTLEYPDTESDILLTEFDNANTDFKSKGMYYIGITCADSTQPFNLVMNLGVAANSIVNIRFLDLYKYNISDYAASILSNIASLNTKNFDYTYQVPVTELIDETSTGGLIYGQAFLNSNNPFNPFTICMLDLSKDPTNKTYSKINLRIMQ